MPDRRLIPGVLVAVVALAAGMWGPAWPARGDAASVGEPLTVMTWNLRRLWGGPDDGGDPLRCAALGIEAAQPDVVALLEVSRDDVDALSAALGLTCAHSTYRTSQSTRHGGLASCVRGSRWQLVSGAGQRFVDDEDWFYVFSEVQRGDTVFNLLAVHLSPYAFSAKDIRTGVSELAAGQTRPLMDLGRSSVDAVRAQSDQAAALLHRVARFEDPTIVAGDFNSTRDVALHTALRRHLTDAWERGGRGFGATIEYLGFAPLRIDYVYTTDAFAVVDAEVAQHGCSDHRPVLTRLALHPR